MKIIECKCPSCGGNLDISADTEYFRCDSCGSSLYVERVVTLAEDKTNKEKHDIDFELFKGFNELYEKFTSIADIIGNEMYTSGCWNHHYRNREAYISILFPHNMLGDNHDETYDCIINGMCFHPENVSICDENLEGNYTLFVSRDEIEDDEFDFMSLNTKPTFNDYLKEKEENSKRFIAIKKEFKEIMNKEYESDEELEKELYSYMNNDIVEPKSIDKIFNKKKYELDMIKCTRLRRLQHFDYHCYMSGIELEAEIKEMCKEYNALPEEQRKMIIKYLYYGNCLEKYSLILSRYITICKLKERFENGTYSMSDLEDGKIDNVSSAIDELVGMMFAIREKVMNDEEKAEKIKLSSSDSDVKQKIYSI